MPAIGQQKLETIPLATAAILVCLAAALSLAAPGTLPWSLLVLAGAAVVAYWTIRWDAAMLIWLWVLSHGLLDWPSWIVRVTGFFNMTVPRFFFVGVLAACGFQLLLRSRPVVRFDRAVLWVMLGLLLWCAASATATGWLAQTAAVRTGPYFRFLGSLLFPFIAFFLMYNLTRNSRQTRWLLIVLGVYGWYALYISYLQYAAAMGLEGARAFIWPGYINDPNFGIHFNRGRGAFSSAPPQAALLIMLFFSDLLLIRTVRGPYRAALIVQAILIPPAIFFTGLRSAYLAFALCGAVWCLWGSRQLGLSKLALALIAVIIGVAAFWGNLAQENRQTGGVAQVSPVEARFILLRQTWPIFSQSPLTGVGFGHFVDAQRQLSQDPAATQGFSGTVLVEHNLFLNVLAETGLVGFAAVVAVFILIFRQSLQLYRKLPPTAMGTLSRPLVVVFWTVLVSYLIDATFRDSLWDVFANSLFWSFAGVIVGYNRLLEVENKSA